MSHWIERLKVETTIDGTLVADLLRRGYVVANKTGKDYYKYDTPSGKFMRAQAEQAKDLKWQIRRSGSSFGGTKRSFTIIEVPYDASKKVEMKDLPGAEETFSELDQESGW